MSMQKLDYRKEWKELYSPPIKPVMVDVPELQYLMIDGQGYPGTSQEYQEAMETLFPLAYTLKFTIKKQQGTDYSVMPLEGLWWADDMEHFYENKDAWKWTSMMLQPEFITQSLFEETVEAVRKKKAPVAIDRVRLEKYAEGKCAQIMHVGPFSAEGPTVEKLHAFIEESGYELAGKHHEIYLSDFRRAAPEKLKTVIRQPIVKN